MKLNRFFVALCAFAALGVSCSKETAPVDSQDSIVVPEGMKYVSFEVGTPTKITGNPVKWNSSEEDISVLALRNGESVNYPFIANPDKVASSTTTKIAGIVDIDAELLYVVYPYKEDNSVDGEKKIHLPQLTTIGYANPGASSNTYFACKIAVNDGKYSAVSNLKPLFSFLNLKFPVRVNDKLSTATAKHDSPLAKTVKITGTGIAGATVVDFSGENPVTTLENDPVEKTLTVTLKQNKNSLLSSAGDYLVPIVPGQVSELEFRVGYEQEYTVKYADYVAEYALGAAETGFSFVRGESYNIELSGPFVKSVATTSATFQGNTLTMSGTADIYVGGKVTVADNYDLKFAYSIKDADDWTEVPAAYDKGVITATADLEAANTYEVKAIAVAKDALTDGEGTADQTIEGDIVETKAYVPPIVVTIDNISAKQYNGTVDGGCWKAVDGVFPTNKTEWVIEEHEYDYYAKNTDSDPLMKGIKIRSNPTQKYDKDGKPTCYYIFKTGCLQGTEFNITFPAKAGYRVTEVDVTISGSSKGKVELYSGTGTTMLTNAEYTAGSGPIELKLIAECGANESVRVREGSTHMFHSFVITYTPVSE